MTESRKTVHFVSLGCPKNRVDSEVMLGHLDGAGYTPVPQAEGADLVVVNTCGFIDAAKEESVDAIAQMAELKKAGQLHKLVVTGCLSQRYAPALAEELPEVDHFLGTGNFETIARVVGGTPLPPPTHKRGLRIVDPPPAPHPRLLGKNRLIPFAHASAADARARIPDPDFNLDAAAPRVATQAAFSQYLKVSEGCSNTCAFCVIPKLRGPQRSRPVDDIVREARALVRRGAQELNLIAQDLCAYGKDVRPKTNLATLLKALEALPSDAAPRWVRLLYAYPKGLSDEVIDIMAGARFIVPYLDMPLQHISDSMLRRMRRGCGGDKTRALLHKLRARLPKLALRTTLITGMPGETEADFLELCDFVTEMRFESLGVFAYSREQDTPAHDMGDQVEAAVAEERCDTLMALQKDISRAQQQARVGQTLDVLVQGPSRETDLLLEGRHAGQAPEIDGVTYITDGTASPGELVQVRIEQAADYDLAGRIVSPAAAGNLRKKACAG